MTERGDEHLLDTFRQVVGAGIRVELRNGWVAETTAETLAAGEWRARHVPTGAVVTIPHVSAFEGIEALRDFRRATPKRPGPSRGREVGLWRVVQAIWTLSDELGREPSQAEVADRLGYKQPQSLSRLLTDVLGPGSDRWHRFTRASLRYRDEIRQQADAMLQDLTEFDA